MTREELLAVGKPILFNTEMVKAILGGLKTVTRRAIKYKNTFDPSYTIDDFIGESDPQILVSCSPYQVGDILYVRETWNSILSHDKNDKFYIFKSTYDYNNKNEIKWCPSIHMPKVASRIFLRVTDIRVERLQDITEEQARAEGTITNDAVKVSSYIYWFEQLWNSTMKKADIDKYSWNANPWVWVIEFERVFADEN